MGFTAGERQSGAFVGAYARLPLGGGKITEAPRAGLKLSMTHQYRDARAEFGGVQYVGEVVDLGFTGDGASLRLAGQVLPGADGTLAYADEDGEKRGKLKWWVPIAVVAGVAAAGVVGFYGFWLIKCGSGACSD